MMTNFNKILNWITTLLFQLSWGTCLVTWEHEEIHQSIIICYVYLYFHIDLLVMFFNSNPVDHFLFISCFKKNALQVKLWLMSKLKSWHTYNDLRSAVTWMYSGSHCIRSLLGTTETSGHFIMKLWGLPPNRFIFLTKFSVMTWWLCWTVKI